MLYALRDFEKERQDRSRANQRTRLNLERIKGTIKQSNPDSSLALAIADIKLTWHKQWDNPLLIGSQTIEGQSVEWWIEHWFGHDLIVPKVKDAQASIKDLGHIFLRELVA